MKNIQSVLNTTIAKLSDQNYEQSFDLVRLWVDIARTHSGIPSDAVLTALQTYRTRNLPVFDNPIDPTAHLVFRFASDAESDPTLAPHSAGLRSRFCAETLRLFFDIDLGAMYPPHVWDGSYHMGTNLVAHCINLGYVEEAVIRNHILQSLIFHQTPLTHQSYALVILFKIAGAALAEYADPVVVDRCFELLKGPRGKHWPKQELIQVNTLSVKGASHRN